MAALTSKILNNTLYFWKTFLFTSLPTCPRLQLTGLCSPYLTLLLPRVLSGSRDSWFSSLAAYFGLSFVHDNWPLFLYCLSKHCCCSGCPGSSGGRIIHSHDRHLGAYCSLICISHYFCGKLCRCPHFNCLQSVYSRMSHEAPQTHCFSNIEFLAMFVLCVSYLRERLSQVIQARRLGIPETLLNLCSRRWRPTVQLLRISRLLQSLP